MANLENSLIKTWTPTEWREKVERALLNSGFDLDDFTLGRIWRRKNSNHSHSAYVAIKGGKNKDKYGLFSQPGLFEQSCPAFAKRHVPMSHSNGSHHLLNQDPDRLYGREIRNSTLIDKLVHPVKESNNPFSYDLVPKLLGCSSIDRLQIVQRGLGKSHKVKIVNAHKTGKFGERDWLISELIKYGARFVGSCTAKKSELLEAHNDYSLEAKMFAGLNGEIFEERLLQLAFRANKQKHKRRKYDSREMDIFLRKRENLDITKRIRTLKEFYSNIGTREVFCHNDYNATHLFGSRRSDNHLIIDVETAGLGDLTEDLSSSLILTQIGFDTILTNNKYFPTFVNMYLAYEHAYEKDLERVNFLDEKLSEGLSYFYNDFDHKEIGINDQMYADVVIGTLARSFNKYVQLSARRVSTAGRRKTSDFINLSDFTLSHPELEKSSMKKDVVSYVKELNYLLKDLNYL